ncbi:MULTISPECIES: phosphatase PAP2/dual specificity phosphatase family protein [Brucella/Ochrobactrum group]|uniref:phosphatase PAP2/dual specificity phosphatase family protein n=1 Tax=Brucella/Ochrobactrum group TaxID=2826938 RepID=UPI000D705A39|nr:MULTISPECIES: phosphatase PAP2/dual specificity phosphatase family protein [Brucella/Ochrobactrum group]MCH4543412.1 phosphatase PAP2/dual specificity phosphatase family protein [Ochrobactrum sp. A-1]PWU75593.1 serine/threonine protein phosphatase [Ochrobactrum sp. POC9]
MTTQLTEVDGSSRWSVIRRAVLWLLFLGPFFYLTYGTANWFASQQSHVPNLAFEWEHHVPFIAWSIIPYWSVNLFYAIALFVNDSPEQVDRLAKRYLTAQIVAVLCFVAFPLTATFVKPATAGLPGFMFDVLGGFDKPFNQAPSLHIALLIIIWDQMRRIMGDAMRVVWHVWCLLIGLSVLTTYQHHAVDIPAGALLGLFALWLFPRSGPSPLAGFRFNFDTRAKRIGFCYLAGAVPFLALAIHGLSITGYAIFWLWPATALAVVALGYLGAGAGIFQKQTDGSVSLASRWLLWPYRLFARLNVRFWTRKLPPHVELADGVFLGRYPKPAELSPFAAVVDLAAEMVPPRHLPSHSIEWKSFGALDLVAPSSETVRLASDAVEAARHHGPVLICCALGFQRSAAVAVAWLVSTGRVASVREAETLIRSKGWPVHLHRAEGVA